MPRTNTRTGQTDDGKVHWKLFGRAYCKAKKPMRITVIGNDVTCKPCKEAVTETWNAIVSKLTPRERESITKAP